MKQMNNDNKTKPEHFHSEENKETVDLNIETFKLYKIPIVWWYMLWVPQNGTYKEKFIFRMINDFECETKCERERECIRYSSTASTEFKYHSKKWCKMRNEIHNVTLGLEEFGLYALHSPYDGDNNMPWDLIPFRISSLSLVWSWFFVIRFCHFLMIFISTNMSRQPSSILEKYQHFILVPFSTACGTVCFCQSFTAQNNNIWETSEFLCYLVHMYEWEASYSPAYSTVHTLC